MTYNGVRDDTQSLRDIQDLIAQLDNVNKQIAHPSRTPPVPRPADADPAKAASN